MAIYAEAQPDAVELCLASPNSSIVRLAARVPTVSLASVVGSLCISNSKTRSSSSLAENALSVLDTESRLGTRPKHLGKVAVELKQPATGKKMASSTGLDFNSDGNFLLQKSIQVTWNPSMSPDIEALEERLAGLLKMDGRMDAKTKADLAKTTKAVLEKCKQRKVSMASDVSARALLALIGTWLLLVICLSICLSVCLWCGAWQGTHRALMSLDCSRARLAMMNYKVISR